MAHPRSSIVGLYVKQLRALLWKSLIIRKVHFISTFFEIVSPLLMIFVFAYIYSENFNPNSKGSQNKSNKTVGPTIYGNPYQIINFNVKHDFFNYIPEYTVYYAPDNPVTRRLMNTFHAQNETANFVVGAFATEGELIVALRKKLIDLGGTYNSYDRLTGVYFHNSEDPDVLKNGQLGYKMRMPGDAIVLSNTLAAFPYKSSQYPVSPDQTMYMYRAFSRVQAYINRELVKATCEANGGSGVKCDTLFDGDKKTVHINRMPYPSFKQSEFDFVNLLDIVAVCLPLSYVLVCPLIVKRITDEKSSKAKELLRLIGMSDAVFYLAHFLNYLCLILLHAIFITIIVFVFKVPLYSASSPLIFFIGVLLWGAQLILFSIFITTIFNR